MLLVGRAGDSPFSPTLRTQLSVLRLTFVEVAS